MAAIIFAAFLHLKLLVITDILFLSE